MNFRAETWMNKREGLEVCGVAASRPEKKEEKVLTLERNPPSWGTSETGRGQGGGMRTSESGRGQGGGNDRRTVQPVKAGWTDTTIGAPQIRRIIFWVKWGDRGGPEVEEWDVTEVFKGPLCLLYREETDYPGQRQDNGTLAARSSPECPPLWVWTSVIQSFSSLSNWDIISGLEDWCPEKTLKGKKYWTILVPTPWRKAPPLPRSLLNIFDQTCCEKYTLVRNTWLPPRITETKG